LSYRFFQDRSAAGHIVGKLARVSLAVLIFGLLFSVSIAAGQNAGRTDRKVIARVQPAYPQILKNAHIGGVVRLKATVLANGTVTKVVILGGNPILAESSVQAVILWKFAASATQTDEEVVLNFDPR
jgi:TonB family protein